MSLRATIAVTLILSSYPSMAQVVLLEALTCSPPSKGAEAQSEVLSDLESKSKALNDGTFVVPGTFSGVGFTISHVHVTGSFGVLMVGGEVHGDPKALVEFVRKRNTDLLAVGQAQEQAGVIAAYEGGKRGLTVFKGTAAPAPSIDPRSKKVSYLCTFQGSGPQ